MAEFSELVQVLTWLLTNRIQQKIDYTRSLLGDGNGRVRVSTIPGSPEVDYVFVRPDRFSNRAFKVFNKRVEGQDGDPIIIGELPWEPGLVQVVDMDWAAYADVGWGDDVTTVNRHGISHQWRDGAPGIDTFNVYRRQFGDLKTYETTSGTLAVGVSPYSLDLFGTQYQWPGTQSFDLAGALPTVTGTARMAMVYWSLASGTTQGHLGVATGTLGGDSEATILNRPVSPQGVIPSAFVRLAGGQTSITEFDIWDAREPFRPGIFFGTGSAGLSADMIPISDVSGFYTGSTIENALEEIPDLPVIVIVKNSSGSAANANEIGYIDDAGEYQTTSTQFLDVAWCVVIFGGANNADIHVARRGRVTVELDGNNSIGDLLYTSTTGGRANPQSYMRSEALAIALTANASGAGGTCLALLLTQTRAQSVAYAENLYVSTALSDSDFNGTIATLPGGAVLTYTPVSGDELNLVSGDPANISKIRLFNSTRSTYGLIENSVAATNTITLTANVDAGWQVGDSITIRSQTNTSVVAGNTYWFDFEIEDSTKVPALARAIEGQIAHRDTGGAGETTRIHPWETNSGAKRRVSNVNAANQLLYTRFFTILIQRRYLMQWTSSGAGTATVQTRPDIVSLASP